MQHTPVFLAAIADVWNSSKQMHKEVELEKSQSSDEKMTDEKVWLTSMNEKSVPVMNALHESLLDIVLAIKVGINIYMYVFSILNTLCYSRICELK